MGRASLWRRIVYQKSSVSNDNQPVVPRLIERLRLVFTAQNPRLYVAE